MWLWCLRGTGIMQGGVGEGRGCRRGSFASVHTVTQHGPHGQNTHTHIPTWRGGNGQSAGGKGNVVAPTTTRKYWESSVTDHGPVGRVVGHARGTAGTHKQPPGPRPTSTARNGTPKRNSAEWCMLIPTMTSPSGATWASLTGWGPAPTGSAWLLSLGRCPTAPAEPPRVPQRLP